MNIFEDLWNLILKVLNTFVNAAIILIVGIVLLFAMSSCSLIMCMFG